jgi:serine O-acetyltransferase
MHVNHRTPPKKSHLTLADRILKERGRGQPALANPMPSPDEIATLVEDLLSVILPGTRRTRMLGPTSHAAARERVAEVLADLDIKLEELVFLGLQRLCPDARKNKDACWKRAQTITARTLAALPELRRLLEQDIQIAFEADPAASGTEEVVACYPGLYAIAIYRAAHRLLREGALLVPRMMTEYAHSRTGIDIHPGASIGAPFFIDHGTGIVIGETTRIGQGVRIYQGVTLGALSISRKHGAAAAAPTPKLAVPQRHPTIEDDVVIYANATILGGDTVIGKGAVVGANARISFSVPAGRRVGA